MATNNKKDETANKNSKLNINQLSIPEDAFEEIDIENPKFDQPPLPNITTGLDTDEFEFELDPESVEVLEDYERYSQSEPGTYDVLNLIDKHGSLQEAAAQEQGAGNKLLKAPLRIASRATHDIINMVGYLGGLGVYGYKGLFSDEKARFSDIVDNAWTNAVDGFFEDVNNSNTLEVYNRRAVQHGDFWKKLGSSEFWATDAANGIGSFISFLAPGAALRGIKFGRGLIKSGIGYKAANNIETASSVVAQGFFESSMEAKGIMDQLKMQGVKDPDILSNQAAKTFIDNMFVTAIPNLITHKMVFGNLRGPAKSATKASSGLHKAPADIAKRSVGNTAQRFAEGAGSEATQELFQYGIEQARTAKENFDESWFDGVGEVFKRTAQGLGETEGQISAFLGGMLGAGGSVVGSIREGKRKQMAAQNLKDMLEETDENFKNLNSGLYKTKVEKDADGNWISKLDTKDGEIQSDPQKIYDRLKSIGKQYFNSLKLDVLDAVKNNNKDKARKLLDKMPVPEDVKESYLNMSEEELRYEQRNTLNTAVLQWMIPQLSIEGGLEQVQEALDNVEEYDMFSQMSKAEKADLVETYKQAANELAESYKYFEKNPKFFTIKPKTNKQYDVMENFQENLKIMAMTYDFNRIQSEKRLKELKDFLSQSEDADGNVIKGRKEEHNIVQAAIKSVEKNIEDLKSYRSKILNDKSERQKLFDEYVKEDNVDKKVKEAEQKVTKEKDDRASKNRKQEAEIQNLRKDKLDEYTSASLSRSPASINQRLQQLEEDSDLDTYPEIKQEIKGKLQSYLKNAAEGTVEETDTEFSRRKREQYNSPKLSRTEKAVSFRLEKLRNDKELEEKNPELKEELINLLNNQLGNITNKTSDTNLDSSNEPPTAPEAEKKANTFLKDLRVVTEKTPDGETIVSNDGSSKLITHNRLAYLTKEYTQESSGKIDKDDHSLLGKWVHLLDPEVASEGSEVEIRLGDENTDIFVDGKVIRFKDYAQQEGVTKQDLINNRPFAVYQGDKLIGYIHATGWVNNKNTKQGFIEREQGNLNKVREYLENEMIDKDNSYVKTKVLSKTSTALFTKQTKNKAGQKENIPGSLEERIKDSEVDFITADVDDVFVINKNGEFKQERNDNNLIPGYSYLRITDASGNIQYIPTSSYKLNELEDDIHNGILNTSMNLITASIFVSQGIDVDSVTDPELKEAYQAGLDAADKLNVEIGEESGNPTLEGEVPLVNYLQNFFYKTEDTDFPTRAAKREASSKGSESLLAMQISNIKKASGEVGKVLQYDYRVKANLGAKSPNQGFINTKNVDVNSRYFKENLKALRTTLSKQYTNNYANNMDGGEVSFIGTDGSITTMPYNEFLWKTNKTILNPIEYDGNYYYTPQPVVTLDLSFANEQKAPTERGTEKQTIPAEGTRVKVDQFNITITPEGKFYFGNGNEVTSQTIKNKALAEKSRQEGTLREYTYNNTKYVILPDNRILTLAPSNPYVEKFKTGKVREKILNAISEQKPEANEELDNLANKIFMYEDLTNEEQTTVRENRREILDRVKNIITQKGENVDVLKGIMKEYKLGIAEEQQGKPTTDDGMIIENEEEFSLTRRETTSMQQYLSELVIDIDSIKAQENAVNAGYSLVLNSILNSENLSKFARKDISKILNNVKASIAADYERTGNTRLQDIYLDLLNNFNVIENRVFRKLKNTIGIQTTTTIDKAQEDNTDQILYDKDSYEIDQRLKLSQEIKLFLSNINEIKRVETDANGNKSHVYKGFAGIPLKKDFNEMYVLLRMLTADLAPDLDIMLDTLREYTTAYPEIQQVIDSLESDETKNIHRLRNQFVTAMSGHAVDSVMVLYRVDRSTVKGEMDTYNAQLIHANSQDLSSVIREQWHSMLLNKKTLFNFKDGKPYFKEDVLNNLVEESERLSSKIYDPVEYKKFFKKLGMDLSINTLNYIRDEKFIYKGDTATTLKGVTSIIKNILKSKEARKNLEDANLFNQTIFKRLSHIDALYNAEFLPNSHRQGNKTVYSFGLNFAAKQIEQDLINAYKGYDENDSSNLLNIKNNTIFTRHSWWLQNMINPEKGREGLFAENFAVRKVSLQAIRKQGEDNRDNRDLLSLTRLEQEIFAINAFLSVQSDMSGNNSRVIDLLYPTQSDKKGAVTLRVPKMPLLFKKNSSTNDLGQETLERLFSQLVAPELERISKFNEWEKNNPGKKLPISEAYNKGRNNFYIIPAMKGIYFDGDQFLDPNGTIEIDGETITRKQAALDLINETAKNLGNRKLEFWKENGIGVNDTDAGRNGVAFKYIDTSNAGYSKNTLERLAIDMEMQYLVSAANVSMLMTGDYAQFFKKDLPTTVENIGKRLAKDVAPGNEYSGSAKEKITYSIVNDNKTLSRAVDRMVKLFGDKTKYNGGIESTDAQELTTLAHHLDLAARLGEIDSRIAEIAKETIKNEIAKKNYLYTDVVRKAIRKQLGEKGLTEFNNIIYNPVKPEYTGKHHKYLDNETMVENEYYIKSSSYPLLPEELVGTQLDKLRIAMETEGIDRVAFKTAAKLEGIPEKGNIFSEIEGEKDAGKFKSLEELQGELKKSSVALPMRGLKRQQENPVKITKREINNVTQASKNLFTDVIKILKSLGGEYAELVKTYQDNWDAIYEEAHKELQNEIYLEDGSLNTGMVKEMLAELAGALKSDINSQQFLELDDHDLRTLIFAPNDFESVMNSLVVNRVLKQKMPGKSYIAASEEGYSNLTAEEMEELYGTSEIDASTKYTKDWKGYLAPDECLISWDITDNNGNLLNIEDYLDEDGYIDTSRLDPEILKAFAMRIPNQGLNFQASLKVVGFLPTNVGDKIITSKDLTVKMGQDFDIDKLYVYRHYRFLDNNDNIAVVKQEHADKLVEYYGKPIEELRKDIKESLDYIKRNNPDLKEEIYDLTERIDIYQSEIDDTDNRSAIFKKLIDRIKDLRANRESLINDRKQLLSYVRTLEILDKLTDTKAIKKNEVVDIYHKIHEAAEVNDEIAKKVYKQESELFLSKEDGITKKIIDQQNKTTEEADNSVFLDSTTQMNKRYSAQSGNSGVGIYANDLILNALGQQLEDGLFLPVKPKTKIVFGSVVNEGGDLIGSDKDYHTLEDPTIYRSDVISAYLTVHVDHENMQVIQYININNITSPFVKVMNGLGFTETTPLITSQPIIKDYVRKLEKYRSGDSFVADAESKAIEELFDEYIGGSFEQFMGEIQSLTKYKEKTLEERKYTGTRLTKSKLLDMIGSKEDVSNFEQTQWALFKKFIILKRFGEDIADLEQVISIDSKGFGKNFAEAIALERASNKLKARPKIGGTEELLNTGIPGRALGALRTSNVLWSNTHFYNSYQASNTLAFIKTHVTKKFNSINQEAEFDNTVYKAMKSFMMTDAGTGLFEENLDNVRQRLFKGSNSLVKRTMALKESDDVNISNNAFINSLDTKKAYNNIAEQVYQNITNINDSTSDRIILGLTDLILNEREVNGVNTRVFAEDLVKGAVLSGNLYGAVDYAKAISPAYLHALPFMNRLATLNSDTLDEVGYFFAEANLDLLNSESPALWPPFILQFFRNHPETILNTNYKKAGKSFTYSTIDTFAPTIFSTFGASNARGRSPYRVFIKTKKEGKTTYYVDIKALNGTFFKQYDANREGSSKLQDSMVNGELTEGIIDELTKIEDLTANKKEALYNSHSKTVSTSQEYRNKLLKSKGNTILTTIVENTNNPLFNQIASILNKLDLGGVSLVIDKNMSQPGKKRGSTVYINPNKLSSVFDMERVVLHEVLHIVTSMNSNEKFKSNMNALFEEAVKSYKKKLSKNELEVFEKAQMLFNKAKKTQKTEDFEEFSKYMSDNNIKHLYGFLSSSEFTSEIFTQPEFQDELNKLSIKGKKGLEAILDKIAEFILNTFKTVTGQKVNKDSALYAGIYNLLKLDTSETIEETQQEETNQPSEEKGMFNDDGDYIVESEEELALEYNRPVDKQLSNLTNVGEAVESSIFDNIAPSKIDLFKSANMIKSDGSVKEFKTSERTLNQLQSKARSIRDAQISEYGIEFYKVEISNNSKNGTSYSTLKLNPVVKDLNSPLEMANLVTDKMIREYQKICR